jgi:hypothetical protein
MVPDGELTMRYILIAGVLLLLAGCQTPYRAQTSMTGADPGFTITEQKRWARETLAQPDESPWVAPPTGLPRPGLWGVPLH